MSNTKTEAQRLADELEKDKWHVTAVTLSLASDELRRLDAAHTVAVELAAQYAAERDQLRAQLAKAVAEEREACAKVCERIDLEYEGEDVQATWCAAAIRARSNT